MTKNLHTPGPWAVSNLTEIINGKFQLVASAQRNDPRFLPVQRSVRELAANARLIAAAPDLLEALIALLPCVYNDDEGRFDRQVKLARQAIAKASFTDGAALATSQGQAVQNLTDPSPSPKEER